MCTYNFDLEIAREIIHKLKLYNGFNERGSIPEFPHNGELERLSINH
jgi:hypothetical protein